MRKNVASQNVACQINSAVDGTPITSSVTIRVNGDGGTQGAGGGTLTHEGNGAWNYVPTQAETNFAHVAFTFLHSTGVAQTINVYPLDFTYQAKVGIIDDDTGSKDIYTANWFKDGVPIFSGITSPTIQVIKESDGSDLIASASMTQIASTGLYKYEAVTTERIIDGAHYIVKITASIDSSTRTWAQWVGRDS